MGFGRGPNIVTDGLVLCLDAASHKSYPGSGTTWYDLSGNGNNGTLTNGPTFSDNSLVFDGSNDYSVSGTLEGSFTNFSVIVWFYPTSITNYENVIDCNYAYNGTTGNIGPRLEIDSGGGLRWIYSQDTTSNSNFYSHYSLGSGLVANKWYHVAITYNGSSNSSVSYYNGNSSGNSRGLVGSATGFLGSFTNVNIGRGFSLGGVERYFTGKISNSLIYNRTISSEEVLQNYNATKSRFGL
jgi:hypothetical protein